MKALVTVFYKCPQTSSTGIPPEVRVVQGEDEALFLTALQLFLMECQLGGRTISSHTVTLLPEYKAK